uniref:Uncharacterized protein n=1 Tax=Tetranychus urticae TaxID=32264 RepID=T1KIK1_TETUR
MVNLVIVYGRFVCDSNWFVPSASSFNAAPSHLVGLIYAKLSQEKIASNCWQKSVQCYALPWTNVWCYYPPISRL